MSKTLKGYDKTQGKWISVSKQNVEVHNNLGESGRISDTNVNVTNPNYANKSDLNEALSTINDDISLLQRNVSWLAEHGGGGGGGTFPEAPFDGLTYGRKDGDWSVVTSGPGGGGGEYKIDVITPVIKNDAVYIRDSKLIVTFRITGGASYEKCKYRYSYDSATATDYKTVKVNEEVTLTFDNSGSNEAYHTLRLDALTPYGISMNPVSFYIYQSRVEIELNKTNNNLISNTNIVLLSQKDRDGYVYVDMTNFMLNTDAILSASYGGNITKTYRYYNESSKKQAITFKLWDLISKENVNVGHDYLVNVKVTANDNDSNEIQIRIRITNPNELSVFLGGVSNETIEDDDDELSTFRQDSNLLYYFKVLVPDSYAKKNVYVAGKIENKTKNTTTLILGKYYDDTLKLDNSTYSKNESTYNGDDNMYNYYLDSSLYDVNDICYISVIAYYDDKIFAEGVGKFKIEVNNSEIYPRQYRPRTNGENPNTLLLSWNAKNVDATSKERWVSKVYNYSPLNTSTEIGEDGLVSYLDVFDSNGVNNGILANADVPYLKLSNFAYAVSDLSNTIMSNEMTQLFAKPYDKPSFTISICFEIPETNDNDGTVFQFGNVSYTGDLINGIRIGLESVTWKIQETTLVAKISQGIRNTIDFVYDGEKQNARIYVNGITNQSGKLNRELTQGNYQEFLFPDKIYFGCQFTDSNGIHNYSDVNIYEFSIYTKKLSDIDIVINSKNARLKGKDTDEDVKADYNKWKMDNYIYSYSIKDENDKILYTTPRSYLTDSNGNFEGTFNEIEFKNFINAARTPVVYIYFDDSVNFIEDYFLDSHNSSEVRPYAATVTYYDGSNNVDFNANVELQGSSTLSYRIKNLEVIVTDTTEHDSTKTKLFQPIPTWFPEKEFTLKADIVDSSHANNASLGKWINESGMFEKTPPMEVFEETVKGDDGNLRQIYRPQEKVFYNSSTDPNNVVVADKIIEHVGKNNFIVDYDEDVTIKHNLEGFPVLVFIRFSLATYHAKLIGIYSFNLGRKSYYNLGLKFLSSFSRRDFNKPDETVSCPALIESYEEIPSGEYFGKGSNRIKVEDVYVYEFGDNGNENKEEYYTFSQDDESWINYLGDFKYEGGEGGIVALKPLFTALAQIDASTVYENVGGASFFTPRDKWRIDANNNKVKVGGDYTKNEDIALQDLENVLHLENAIAYFVICNAFGMVDSTSKNLQLRTWDKKKWYTGFYDMDSALGLKNTGDEGVPEDASIDTFQNEKDGDGVTQVYFKYSENERNFNGYRSKLWGVLRCGSFFYEYKTVNRYDDVWCKNRESGKVLSSYKNFTNIMEEQINKCSELVYNYDYDSKYIKDGTNLFMLHGTRIEYVKKWLRNRFYFLDGYFHNNKDVPGVFSDSPYYNDKLDIANGGKVGKARFVLNSKISTFSSFKAANDGQEYFFFIPANTPTEVIMDPGNTSDRQAYFRSSSLFTQMEGLNDIAFYSIKQNISRGSLRSLTELDLSSVKTLSDNAINFIYNNDVCIFTDVEGRSSLRTLKLNNTEITAEQKTFPIILTGYNKLQNVDISNSQIDSLVLPDTSIKTLKISNSNIVSLDLKNQTILDNIDFSGCNKLTTIVISNCSRLEKLDFTELKSLSSIKISNCGRLDRINISNCKVLDKIEFFDNDELREISIDNVPKLTDAVFNQNEKLAVLNINKATNTNLSLSIDDASFERISLNDINTTNALRLPSVDKFKNLTELELTSVNKLDEIYYKDESGNDVLTDVLDLSYVDGNYTGKFRFTRLKSPTGLKKIRFKNDRNNPVKMPKFEDCSNIERLFGNIEVLDTTKFTFGNFKLNDGYGVEVEGVSTFGDDFFLEGNNVTNLTFSANTTDINQIFSTSSISLDDVYYVLSKCGNIKNLNGAFKSCSKITCAPESVYDYKEYNDGTNEIKTFKKPNNTLDDDNVKRLNVDMFSKCSNVENIDNLFNGCENLYSYIDVEHGIFEKLTKITRFKNVFLNCVTGFKSDMSILGDISKNIIELVGFDSWPYRQGANYQYYDGEILKGFDNLQVIENSFNRKRIVFNGKNITDVKADDGEMFTGLSELREIKHSFKYIDWDIQGGGRQFCNFNGRLFEGCKNLELIEDSFSIYGTPNIGFHLVITNEMFEGCPNLTKIIKGSEPKSEYCFSGFVKVYDIEKGFPTEVLTYVPNATMIEKLYSSLRPYDFSANDYAVDNTVVKLPGEMFKSSYNLENVKGFFEDITNGITVELTSNGFVNCKITDFSGVFSGCKRKGMIPYKLFYQDAGNIIKDMSNCLSNGNNSDVALECFTFDMDNEELRNELFINKKSYGYLDGDVKRYTTDKSDAEGKPGYVEFDYAWNLLAYDGSSDFIERFNAISSLFDASTYPVGYYPELFSDYRTIRNSPDSFNRFTNLQVTDNIADAFSNTNYICPADLFAYCENANDTSVNGALSSAGKIKDGRIFGYCGRIPNNIFKPISNVGSLSGIFGSTSTILPHKWCDKVGEGNGEMYPIDLFKGIKASNLSSLFSENEIWGECVIPDMFSELSKTLRDISRMWQYTTWNEINQIKQLPSELFNECGNIWNISGLFSYSYNLSLPDDLFKSGKNNIITNCAEFLRRITNPKKINLIPFWKWPAYNDGTLTYGQCYSYNGVTTTNSEVDDWNKWIDGYNN